MLLFPPRGFPIFQGFSYHHHKHPCHVPLTSGRSPDSQKQMVRGCKGRSALGRKWQGSPCCSVCHSLFGTQTIEWKVCWPMEPLKPCMKLEFHFTNLNRKHALCPDALQITLGNTMFGGGGGAWILWCSSSLASYNETHIKGSWYVKYRPKKKRTIY